MTNMPPTTLINTEIAHPWLPAGQQAVNADFTQRVVVLPGAAKWQATGFDGLQLRIFEYMPGEHFRLTAQLRASSPGWRSLLHSNTGMEALVQAGELGDLNNVYPAGLYLREPAKDKHSDPADALHFGCADDCDANTNPGLLFLSLGQFAESDTEIRHINTDDESLWLPGPEEGTEVMPLHVHGSSNSMLLRWTDTATFVPRLDPCGEEVLVLRGTLRDEAGQYPTGSWVRNPIETWQSWSADAGTVIYYRNGHFPDPQNCDN